MARLRGSDPGHAYVIKVSTPKNIPIMIKIGSSLNVEKRISTYTTSLLKTDVLLALPTYRPLFLERLILHSARANGMTMKGEWVSWSRRNERVLLEECKRYLEVIKNLKMDSAQRASTGISQIDVISCVLTRNGISPEQAFEATNTRPGNTINSKIITALERFIALLPK